MHLISGTALTHTDSAGWGVGAVDSHGTVRSFVSCFDSWSCWGQASEMFINFIYTIYSTIYTHNVYTYIYIYTYIRCCISDIWYIYIYDTHTYIYDIYIYMLYIWHIYDIYMLYIWYIYMIYIYIYIWYIYMIYIYIWYIYMIYIYIWYIYMIYYIYMYDMVS